MGKGVDERGVAVNEYRLPLGDGKKKYILFLNINLFISIGG